MDQFQFQLVVHKTNIPLKQLLLFIFCLVHLESPSKQIDNEERAAKRRKMDEEDEKERIKNAKEILNLYRQKQAESIKLTKNIRVKPSDRPFLQELVFTECFNSTIQVFPKDAHWKVIWNRLVDGYSKEKDSIVRLLKIEKEIFLNIKKEVEEFYGHRWSGTEQENSYVDHRIALSVKQSFQTYEKDKSKEKTYFKFEETKAKPKSS